MHMGVLSDEGQHIVQRMGVGLRRSLQSQRQLVGGMEHLADFRFAVGSVNIRKFVIYDLHKAANGFIDPAGHFLGRCTDGIAVHIDGGFLQALGQVQLRIGIAFPHLHTLRFFYGFVLGKLRRCIQAQELLNLQILPDLIQKCSIIRQHNQNLASLAGHHAKRSLIVSALIPRGKNAKPKVITLIGFIRPVIHSLIEAEGIPAVECRIAVFLVGEDVLENHLGNLVDDLRHLHVLAVDLAVNLLLLIGQENIEAAVFLHQHLPHQHFQGFFHLLLDGDAIIVDIFDHETYNVVDVGFNLQHIFDHEECLQDIDGEDIALLVIRVDVAVVIGFHDHTLVAVIQEVLQRVIEPVERHNRADFFLFDSLRRFLEKCQHGAFALG